MSSSNVLQGKIRSLLKMAKKFNKVMRSVGLIISIVHVTLNFSAKNVRQSGLKLSFTRFEIIHESFVSYHFADETNFK